MKHLNDTIDAQEDEIARLEDLINDLERIAKEQ